MKTRNRSRHITTSQYAGRGTSCQLFDVVGPAWQDSMHCGFEGACLIADWFLCRAGEGRKPPGPGPPSEQRRHQRPATALWRWSGGAGVSGPPSSCFRSPQPRPSRLASAPPAAWKPAAQPGAHRLTPVAAADPETQLEHRRGCFPVGHPMGLVYEQSRPHFAVTISRNGLWSGNSEGYPSPVDSPVCEPTGRSHQHSSLGRQGRRWRGGGVQGTQGPPLLFAAWRL